MEPYSSLERTTARKIWRRGTVCTRKSGSKYAQNIEGQKTRFYEVPNMRDERQFAVKDKTQKTGFGLKRNGLLLKKEGRHRKQPT